MNIGLEIHAMIEGTMMTWIFWFHTIQQRYIFMLSDTDRLEGLLG